LEISVIQLVKTVHSQAKIAHILAVLMEANQRGHHQTWKTVPKI